MNLIDMDRLRKELMAKGDIPIHEVFNTIWDQPIVNICEVKEQQSCEDCISREAVIEWLKDKDIIKTKNQEENAKRELAFLSSVIPQQPCEDCISRNDAIELIAGTDETNGNEPVFSGKQVIKMLKGLPSVTQKTESENKE